MQAFRRPSIKLAQTAANCRQFHANPRLLIKVGDAIPDVEVQEDSPGNKLSIAKELKGKGLIIGIPAAFSPACTGQHIPGYISHKDKLPSSVFVVAVNDAFVMKAWGASLPNAKESGIRFIADPAGTFNKALGMIYGGEAIFGNARSKRYAIIVEDGKAKKVFEEPDNTGLDATKAENVLPNV